MGLRIGSTPNNVIIQMNLANLYIIYKKCVGDILHYYVDLSINNILIINEG